MDFYDILAWFGRHAAWLLLPAASIMYTWILEAKKRKDMQRGEEYKRGVDVSKLVKVFSFIGMVYGFFLMIGAVMAELTGSSPSLAFRTNWGLPNPADPLGLPFEVVNHFTNIMYFITGMVMFFKPLKDVPFASLISLGAAAVVTLLAAWTIPNDRIGSLILDYVIELKWLLLIVFLVVLAIVYSLTKVSFTLMTKFSRLISMPPFALLYATFILTQGVILLFGYSIVMW